MRDLPPPSTHRCGIPGAQEELLSQTEFDRFEMQALDLMRLIFAAQSGHRPRHGATPESVARSLFGDEGPVLLVAIAELVRAVALSRPGQFRYANPYCAGCARVLTGHEARVLRMVHHLRRDRPGAATVQALLLCGAQPIAALIEAAGHLRALAPPAQV